MRFEEWWNDEENCISKEMKEDLKYYYNIDKEWFRKRIPLLPYTDFDSNWNITVRNVVPMASESKTYTFIVLLENSFKDLVVAEKIEVPKEKFHHVTK